MTVCLFSQNEAYKKFFISELLLFGVTVYVGKDMKETLSIMAARKVDCFFADIDSKGVQWKEFIQLLKEKAPDLFIVLLTASRNQEYLNSLIMEGVNAVFNTNQALAGYLNKIHSILRILETESHHRQYERIQPDPRENLEVFLEIDGREHAGYVRGKVSDISAIAIAAVVPDENSLKYINEGTKVPNLQITLNKKTVYCEAKVIRKVRKTIVLQYIKRSSAFNTALAEYIFLKINACAEGS